MAGLRTAPGPVLVALSVAVMKSFDSKQNLGEKGSFDFPDHNPSLSKIEKKLKQEQKQ